VRDVVQLNGTTTTVEDHIVYNSCGVITSQSSSNDQPLVFYDGMPFDAVTQFYNEGARKYSAVDQVFASMDPIGFNSGQTNLSEFCGNSPTNATDPSGETDYGDPDGNSWWNLPGLIGAPIGRGWHNLFGGGMDEDAKARDLELQIMQNHSAHGTVDLRNKPRAAQTAGPATTGAMQTLAGADVAAYTIVPGFATPAAGALKVAPMPRETVRPAGQPTGEITEEGASNVVPTTRSLGSSAPSEQSPLLQRYLNESGGRWGGTATRQLNDQIARQYIDQGYRITGGAGRAPEEWIAGPGGGTKGGTFVDITAYNGTQTVRIQTVSTLADGVTPTSSEAAAAARIRAAFPNDQLILVSKQTGQVIP
jgi:RHS repeat-associated protein